MQINDIIKLSVGSYWAFVALPIQTDIAKIVPKPILLSVLMHHY